MPQLPFLGPLAPNISYYAQLREPLSLPVRYEKNINTPR